MKKTFMDQYQEKIEPAIKAIDLFIKTESPPYNLSKAACLMQIPFSELKQIMRDEKIATLDKNSFFQIMEKGSAPICRMFARELKCGIPQYYTAENISYIYDLDISKVLDASERIGVYCYSKYTIPILFRNIPITADTQ